MSSQVSTASSAESARAPGSLLLRCFHCLRLLFHCFHDLWGRLRRRRLLFHCFHCFCHGTSEEVLCKARWSQTA